LYNVREIWWCRLGLNIGNEQDGKGQWYLRPCVIVTAFGAHACFVVPLTTAVRKHKYRIYVGLIDGKEARANISQMRIIDTRRLVEKIEFMDLSVFKDIRKALRNLF
jgi:mRNA interferase MazF